MAKICIGSLGTLFLIRFLCLVASHIRKNYRYKQYKIQLEEKNHVLPKIIKEIDEKMIALPINFLDEKDIIKDKTATEIYIDWNNAKEILECDLDD